MADNQNRIRHRSDHKGASYPCFVLISEPNVVIGSLYSLQILNSAKPRQASGRRAAHNHVERDRTTKD
jgi:hypothetical protein